MSQETVLITGGSGAIAGEIARSLASPERMIVINFRADEAPALEVVESVRSHGGDGFAVQADISQEDQVERMFEEIKSRTGRLDVLIHNASPDLVQSSILKSDWAEFQRQMNVNVKGSLLCSQAALRIMKEQKQGHILAILTSYVLGASGSGFSSYVTAKYAQMGLMHCLADEAIRWGIRVNMISPSLNKTELVSCLPDRLFEIAGEQHPLNRLCTPSDVAGAVKFLLSGEATFINRVNLPVTGGSS